MLWQMFQTFFPALGKCFNWEASQNTRLMIGKIALTDDKAAVPRKAECRLGAFF